MSAGPSEDKCVDAYAITASIFIAGFTRWATAESTATSSATSTARHSFTYFAVSAVRSFKEPSYSFSTASATVNTNLEKNWSRTYLRQQCGGHLGQPPPWRDWHKVFQTFRLSLWLEVHCARPDPRFSCGPWTPCRYQIRPPLLAYHTW